MELKIPQQISEEKKVGTLRLRYIATRFVWFIPNILSLSQRIYFISPVFQFQDAKWFLVMFLGGEDEDLDSGYFKVCLCKESSDFKTHGIQYRIGIEKTDGRKFWASGEEPEFEDYQSLNDGHMSEGDESSRKWTELIKVSDLRKCSSELLTQDVLTVFCSIREDVTGDSDKADASTEIDAHAQLSAADSKKLRFSMEGSDAILKVQDREFRVHRKVLQTHSKVFKSMFEHDMKESNSGILSITDCDPEAFEDLLLYVYCGDVVEISTKNMFSLYQAADKFGVIGLKEICVQFIISNLSVDTFCDVFELGLRHNESSLIRNASEFFVSNEKEIIAEARWLCFQKNHPVEANKLHLKALSIWNSL